MTILITLVHLGNQILIIKKKLKMFYKINRVLSSNRKKS